MSLLLLMQRLFDRVCTRLSWVILAGAILLHFVVTYIGLKFADEEHLLDITNFIYWYVTTTSTTGYGDLAPQSGAGRVFVALWVMIGGIALMTATIGKTTAAVIQLWRANMKGLGYYSDRIGHTVIVGWIPGETGRVVDLLLEDSASNDSHIVVVDSVLKENPMPGATQFIHCDFLGAEGDLVRAGVRGAERVIVHASDDNQTLSAVLAVSALDPIGHVVAHFRSSETAALARKFVPNLECTSSMATEMLVRAAQDPGTSTVINELLCIGNGATQFSCPVKDEWRGMNVGRLSILLKSVHNATLLGYRPNEEGCPMINPPADMVVGAGVIFYISDDRITEQSI